jgi:3-oxoacyl-[acyl-carrier-protein] synthase II
MKNERRVVITGCGVATPLGVGVESFWDGLINRRVGVRRTTAFDPGGLATAIGAETPSFKVTDYVPRSYRKSTKVMARDIELAVGCAYEAVKDARLKTRCLIERGEADGDPDVPANRFGANIGAGLICADLPELAGALQLCGDPATGAFDMKRWGGEGMSNLTPLWLLKFLPNMLGCHVTIVHDCQAPSNTITCGEASSHLAIGEAFRTIARGAADACICGGAESKMNPMGILRQQLIGRLVVGRDDVPETACRPFDPSADGMVAAESGGLLILEDLAFAKARGARVYAEVVGFGAAANTFSCCAPEPGGEGIAVAVRNALADAGVRSGEVDLVMTHGTGLNAYDAAEAAGLGQALAGRSEVPALAIKGAVGNSGAGSGALDLTAAALAVYHNTIPPSANTAAAETGGTLRFMPDGPVDARLGVAVSLAYSLSGSQIAAVVIRKFVD